MYTYTDLNIKDHTFFNTLQNIKCFHESISYNLFGSKTKGIKGFVNIHLEISNFLALQLESIDKIISIGNLGDSFTILRKYVDLTLISVYMCLKEENEKFADKKIEDWPWIIDELNNWASNENDYKMKSFEKINQIIRESQLKDLLNLIESKIDYIKLRNTTGNRYTHFNQFRTVYSLRELDTLTIDKILNQIEYVLTHYFIRYFALLANIREDFFRSSDYIDYLDAGLTPPDEALYWVSPFANDLLNDVVFKHRPDIGQYIIDNSQMQWELNKDLKN